MNIESIAASASINSQQKASAQVATAVLKKTLEIAQASAEQMLSTLPSTPAPAVGSTAGGHINTTA